MDDHAVASLVADVRASTERATAAEFDALAADVPGSIVSLSVRAWPADFHGPRIDLGPPWTKDHRVALAAKVIAW